jgi:protocatechuate 3,4-dioxygenase, beta subunit
LIHPLVELINVNSSYEQLAMNMKSSKSKRCLEITQLVAVLIFISSTQQVFSQPKSSGDSSTALAWKTVITSSDEPGEPLIVSGTVYKPDGKTPAAGITVYVYHTDAEGYYRKGSNSSSNPRLNGTMITNAEGKYEFRTIKPGNYPGGGVPAHVHYVLSGKGYEKQYEEVMFEGDPYLSERVRANAAKDGTFATARPLTRDKDGVWRCVRDVKLEKK